MDGYNHALNMEEIKSDNIVNPQVIPTPEVVIPPVEVVKEVVKPKTQVIPKQIDNPNLNAGNNSEENKWAQKWKTPEERKAACDEYCKYLSQGRTKEYFPSASPKTIKSYIEKYPEDFLPEKIEDAERAGLAKLEGAGVAGMYGKIPGFNVTAWIFIVKNKLKWTDRHDIGIGGELGKDGKRQPIQLSVNAGNGFLPATLKVDAPPAGSITAIPAAVQSNGVAPESAENNNGNLRNSQAGTS